MFIPYFIALFLGLVCPTDTTNYQTNTTMVSATGEDPGDPGEPDPGDDGTGGGTGGGSTGGGTGTGGTGGGSTGGEGSQPPPPKP